MPVELYEIMRVMYSTYSVKQLEYEMNWHLFNGCYIDGKQYDDEDVKEAFGKLINEKQPII